MQIKSLKKSRQREAVYDFLMTRKDHPTADFIYENVRKTFPNISLGTVYRNLNLLVELGQAQRFSTYDGYDHFDGNPAPHYHFVCNKCRCVLDIDTPADDGFKAGVIKKLTDFIGMFVVIILAFYLKNYISVIMYENLPFFNFFGLINGIDALNILLYEVIAFLVIFIALLFVLKVVLMLTGLVEKILKATVILSIPSKLLGIVVGVIEMYVYLFLILVIVSLPIFDSSFLKDSKMNNFILNNTPVLSGVSEEIIDIYGDVYNIIDNRKNKTNEQLNEEILKVLIDKKVVTKESAKKLVDKNKIHINDKSIVE